MALPIRPINPNNPIPNTPFYAPPVNYVQGEYSPFTVGSGLTLDQITGVLSATGGVAGIIGGPGINVVTGGTPPGSTSTISNTGVITLAASAPLVVGGTASNRTLTVNAATVSTTGVVSIGSNISVSPGGAISVATASTAVAGVVQLNNTTASSSTTQALTAAQGRSLQDQINALLISNNITFAGTLDTVTGNMISVTTAGTAAGFAASSPLPAPALLNNECFVIVEVAATSYTPPGGTPTQTHVGDWFLSDGTAWSFLNVGFDPPYATTTTPGVVELATDAETQAGTDATLAVTPAGAAATYVPLADYATKGDILAATAANTPTALAVGTNGQILFACTAAATGLCWAPAPSVPNATPILRGILFGCTASSNAALGEFALKSVTSGQSNTAVGYNAMCALTTAIGSTALGDSAASNATGCQNLAVGAGSLFNNATGNFNTAIGYYSMVFSSGSSNSGLGHNSLRTVSGTSNVGVGINAGNLLTSGNSNVIIGPNVQATSATGSCQLALGFDSGQNWLTGDSTKAIRPGAGIIDCAGSCGTAGQLLASDGANAVCWKTVTVPVAATPTAAGIVLGCTTSTNTALGCNAALAVTGTGTGNTALGSNAGCSITSGAGNAVVGCSAGCSITTGSANVLIGETAGCSITGGAANVAIGAGAGLDTTTGAQNVTIGQFTGCCMTTGSRNVAIGFAAQVASNTGSCQLALGFSSTNNWLTGDSTKAIKPGAGIIDCAGSCGTACQVLISTGSNAITWTDSTAPSKLTSTKALTSGTPIDLLSWATGVRMGALAVFATDNSTNVKWANITVGSASGVGSTAVTTQSVGMGTVSIVAGGGGETIVRFTPSVTLASVNFVFQYNAAFGNQPSVL
jgi:hypothetical protein